MGDLGGNSYEAGSITEEERTWAMLAHLGTLAGSVIPFGNLLAPFIVWLVQKDKSDFVNKHAKESLVFQIALMIVITLLALLVIVTLGVGLILAGPLILALFLADLIYMILATVRANEGKIWEYPITSRFVS
jgi:uncharacterized Tic20 family protein